MRVVLGPSDAYTEGKEGEEGVAFVGNSKVARFISPTNGAHPSNVPG